jgi:hypothetical protein
MPRAITAGFAQAIAAKGNKPALFFEVNFLSGPVYLWSGTQSIVWNSRTWLGAGGLINVSTVEESSTVEAKGITLSMSGVSTSFLADILDEFQVGLPAIVYLGFFADTGTSGSGGYGLGGYGSGGYGSGGYGSGSGTGGGVSLIPDPVIAWAGRTDQPTIEMDGSTATISVNCEHRFVEMNVAVDRRYTNEDQQLDYPGDRGLEFVNSIQDVRIFWGQVPSSKNNL